MALQANKIQAPSTHTTPVKSDDDRFLSPESSHFSTPVPDNIVSHVTMVEPEWKDLGVHPSELRVGLSLSTGQCFNWRPMKFNTPTRLRSLGRQLDRVAESPPDAEATVDVAWVGVLGKAVVAVAETPTTTLYACLNPAVRSIEARDETESRDSALAALPNDSLAAFGHSTERGSLDGVEAALRDYFQISTNLSSLRSEWCAADRTRMEVIADCLPGLRVLRQDPVECLFSFIVSSNNNISRITLILNKLREAYGEHLLTLSSTAAPSSSLDESSSSVRLLLSPEGSVRGKATGSLTDVDNEGTSASLTRTPVGKKKTRKSLHGDDTDHGDFMSSPSGNEQQEQKSPLPASGATRLASPSSSRSKTVEAAQREEQRFYSFPTVQKLAEASEEELRALGLGYRARFVKETAAALVSKDNPRPASPSSSSSFERGGEQAATDALGGLLSASSSSSPAPATIPPPPAAPLPPPSASSAATVAEFNAEPPLWPPAVSCASSSSSFSFSCGDGGRLWLESLRDESKFSREEVQKELLAFTGVGQKVADCVALFSLDRSDVIPVDTHVWRIACRDLDPALLEAKSLTPAVYNRVGDLFRGKFPSRSGWAHSLLFAAELPNFRLLLPAGLQQEMVAFKEEEKQRNAEKKEAKQKRKQSAGDDDETAASAKPSPKKATPVRRLREKEAAPDTSTTGDDVVVGKAKRTNNKTESRGKTDMKRTQSASPDGGEERRGTSPTKGRAKRSKGPRAVNDGTE